MLVVNQRAGFGDGDQGPIIRELWPVSQNNYDPYAAAGRPPSDSNVAEFVIHIADGVVLGSSSIAEPALKITDDWPTGAVIRIQFHGTGRIQGKGGAGGEGSPDESFDAGPAGGAYLPAGGGGGGGAGAQPGAGGKGSPGDGQDGTGTSGGVGGVGGGNDRTLSLSSGHAGGTALEVERDVTLDASEAGADGSVWGGGGGGGGGSWIERGGNGGDPGQAGATGEGALGASGGAPGSSIEDNGHTVTIIGELDALPSYP